MTYIEKTNSYNEKRYGRPWMAIVTTSCTKDLQFIDWEGRNGLAGEFSFEAEPGTLLAWGQKDMRKSKGGIDGYQICMPDGSMPGLGLAGIDAVSPTDLRRMKLEDRVIAFAHAVIKREETAVREYLANAAKNPAMVDETSKKGLERIAARITQYKAFLPVEVAAVATATTEAAATEETTSAPVTESPASTVEAAVEACTAALLPLSPEEQTAVLVVLKRRGLIHIA